MPDLGLFWLGPAKYRNPPQKYRHPTTKFVRINVKSIIKFDNHHGFRMGMGFN